MGNNEKVANCLAKNIGELVCVDVSKLKKDSFGFDTCKFYCRQGGQRIDVIRDNKEELICTSTETCDLREGAEVFAEQALWVAFSYVRN